MKKEVKQSGSPESNPSAEPPLGLLVICGSKSMITDRLSIGRVDAAILCGEAHRKKARKSASSLE
jgi:hypothetical protein